MFYLKVAQAGWKTWLADVTAAFLQGDATEEKRELYAEPVAELRAEPHGRGDRPDREGLLRPDGRSPTLAPEDQDGLGSSWLLRVQIGTMRVAKPSPPS